MKFLARLVVVLAGVAILYLSAPHKHPWGMKFIESSLSEDTQIQVRHPKVDLAFSADTLGKSIALLLLGLIVLFPRVRRSLRHLWSQPRRLILLAFALGYLLFTLKPTPNGWGIILYLIFGTLGVAMVLIGLAPLLTWIMDKWQNRGERIVQWFYNMPAWRILAVLFLFSFTAMNLGSYFIFERIPHIQDSIGQVFHGKIFLLGKLTASSPEPRESFNFTHIINNGKWYSEYPPGHSLLMSIGHLLHAPWIINPLFGSLSILLLYFIGKEMYDERIGRLSALLGALSPFIVFMSSEFMNHTTTLFFTELFLLAFARMMHRWKIRDALLTGFALGYAFNIRPMTAVAIGLPFALYALCHFIREMFRSRPQALHRGIRCLVAMIVFGVMVGAFLGFNYLTNGDPFLTGYEVLYGKGHNPGFGHSGWGEPHTPQKGFTQTLNNLNALNKYLFELPIPSLLFALLAVASTRSRVWDWLLLAYPSSMALAYFFYWFQDWCFGPRFMFASAAAFILLTARGIVAIPHIAHELLGIDSKQRVGGTVAIVLVFCFSLGFASNIPVLIRTYSNNYWGVNAQVLKSVRKMDIQNAVVFVKSYYGSVFAANHPRLESEVIYARDLGEEKNRTLMVQFPDRQFYLADGDSVVPYPTE